MKLPKSVRVGIYDYRLIKVTNLKHDFGDGDTWLYGYVSHTKPRIEIENRLSGKVQLIAVLHESMHAIIHQCGQHDIDRVIEERLIQSLSHGVVSLFADNPKLLKALNKVCKG